MSTEPPPGRALAWLDTHSWWLALGITALGFALRWHGTGEFWLNPDEGIYLQAALGPTSFWDELRANAHPPLYYAILRGLSVLTHDFDALRWVSLLASTGAIYALFAAGRAMSAAPAGLAAALLAALSSGAIQQARVLRPYSLLVLLLALALWQLAAYLRGGGKRPLAGYGVALLLAVSTHYSAFLAVGAVGLALGTGLLLRSIPRRQVLPLLAGSAPALLAMAGLWMWHIAPNLEGQELQRQAVEGWLKPHFIHGMEFLEVWFHLVGVARYVLIEEWEVGLLLLLGCGIASGLWGGQLPRLAGLIATFALLIGVAAARTFKYPFSFTRHSMYLLPLLALPIGHVATACVGAARRWVGVGSGLAVVLLLVGHRPLNDLAGITERFPRPLDELVLRRSAVEQTLVQLHRFRDAGHPVLMDVQTYYSLAPMFAGANYRREPMEQGVFRFAWGRSTVLVNDSWTLTIDDKSAGHRDELDDFLRRAAARFPQLELTKRHFAVLLVTGWSQRLVQQLGKLERTAGAGRFVGVFSPADSPHLAGLQIDLSIFARVRAERR
ncbi:MAG: glycosyltransferase family 39 protein [Planctomycetes bacterium]|nr:glycosyltransferase family 39 protein [Planctomycetota bacterium]